jgi:hypothetical protein
MIAFDLEQRGVGDADVRAGLDVLEPESRRAAAIIESRGCSPRTLRRLAASGFSEETLESLIADLTLDAVE